MPRLRQRYLRVPFGLNHPVWVDDPAFDLDYHLRRVGCPAPGTMIELCELICELYAHPLDHTRPLWQIWVIEGLEGGRVGVLLLIHHALTDGIGILRMLNNFWQTRPEAIEHPDPGGVASRPAAVEVAAARWRAYVDLPGVISPPTCPARSAASRAGRRIVAQWRREGRTLPPAAGDAQYPAPYATRLSPQRTFAARSFALAASARWPSRSGVTINDVFLAATGGRNPPTCGSSRRAPRRPHRWSPRCPSRWCRWPSAPATATSRRSATRCCTPNVADPRRAAQGVQAVRGYDEGVFRGDARGESSPRVLNLLPPLVPKLVDRINEMKGGGLLPFWNVVASNVPGPRACRCSSAS